MTHPEIVRPAQTWGTSRCRRLCHLCWGRGVLRYFGGTTQVCVACLGKGWWWG